MPRHELVERRERINVEHELRRIGHNGWGRGHCAHNTGAAESRPADSGTADSGTADSGTAHDGASRGRGAQLRIAHGGAGRFYVGTARRGRRAERQ